MGSPESRAHGGGEMIGTNSSFGGRLIQKGDWNLLTHSAIQQTLTDDLPSRSWSLARGERVHARMHNRGEDGLLEPPSFSSPLSSTASAQGTTDNAALHYIMS